MRYLPLLLLADSGYTVRIWRKFSHDPHAKYILADEIVVGIPFIPFAFVGAVNNDAQPDTPPMLDLANLNLAHYRNSADFEESAFVMGQPQLVITGVTEDWKTEQGLVTFGARGALVLPIGGDAKLLQVSPNTLAKEAMLDNESISHSMWSRFSRAA